MSRTSGTVMHAGFPDFWEKAYSLNPEAYRALGDLYPIQNALFKKPVKKPVLRVMRFMTKVVGNSAGSVMLLTLNGFGNDAMRIARSMFEGAVTVGYLRLHPEEYKDFRDFLWVKQKRRYDYLVKHDPVQLSTVQPKHIKRMMRRYPAVVGRFTGKNGRIRHSWCRKPISQMADEVGLGKSYSTFYSTASSMHHFDVTGLSAQLESERIPDADSAPSENWLEESLNMAHKALLVCLVHYNNAARLGMSKGLKAARKDFMRTWKK